MRTQRHPFIHKTRKDPYDTYDLTAQQRCGLPSVSLSIPHRVRRTGVCYDSPFHCPDPETLSMVRSAYQFSLSTMCHEVCLHLQLGSPQRHLQYLFGITFFIWVWFRTFPQILVHLCTGHGTTLLWGDRRSRGRLSSWECVGLLRAGQSRSLSQA